MGGNGLEFRILGPVEVLADGRPVDLGGLKERGLLALLLLHANEPLSGERLLSGLWGDDPPATAPKMLQIYVSRLRRTLRAVDGEGVLQTRRGGYLLELRPEQLDISRFRSLTAEGRFTEALALWRGAPLAELQGEPFAGPVIAELEEARMAALEERIEVDLAHGRHGAVASELRGLVAQHPYRERFRAQLMLALYRSGRQADALEVYRDARSVLVEELGIEPGPELQRLQVAVLKQDPALQAPGAAERRPATAVPPVARAATRFPAAAVAGPLVLLGLLLVVVFAADTVAPGSAGVTVSRNSAAIVDTDAARVVGSVPVGTAPGPVAIADHSVWIGNRGDKTISRIDLRTRTTQRTFGVTEQPASLTAGDNAVWIGDGFSGRLSRILTSYDQLSAPFFPGAPLSGVLAVTVSPGDLWVGLGDGSLLRLDPASLAVRGSWVLGNHPRAIVVDKGMVWSIDFGDNDLERLDPAAGRITFTLHAQHAPVAIAVGAGAIWMATAEDDRLWRIDDRTGQVVGSVPLGVTPTAILAAGGSVWVAGGADGILERVDAGDTSLTRTLKLGGRLGGLALAGNNLWVAVA